MKISISIQMVNATEKNFKFAFKSKNQFKKKNCN